MQWPINISIYEILYGEHNFDTQPRAPPIARQSYKAINYPANHDTQEELMIGKPDKQKIIINVIAFI